MKRKGLNIWVQAIIFILVSGFTFVATFVIALGSYQDLVIIGLFFVILLIFLSFLFLPMILDKFRPFICLNIYKMR